MIQADQTIDHAERSSAEVIATRTLRRRFSYTLLAWSIGSIVLGIVPIMGFGEEGTVGRFVHAVGWQFLIWGAIDLLFAIPGVLQARRADARPAGDLEAMRLELVERDNLIKALGFSMKLNWFWLACAAGLFLAAVLVEMPGRASLLGHGVGVAIQGGFLFLLDRGAHRRLSEMKPA